MSRPVEYQTAYLWTCPECGIAWQLRHRPRTGANLVCAPQAEQRQISRLDGFNLAACGSINVSAGRRGGIAPNVSI